MGAFAAIALLWQFAALAQAPTPPLKDRIQGAWALHSIVLDQGGTKSEPYGANPNGFASFFADGRFSYMIIRSDLPKVASGDRWKATPEEMKAIFLGSLAYFGRYTVDEQEGMLTLHTEVSSYPNASGTGAKRRVVISGDEMRLVNPSPSMGGSSLIIWKRFR